MSLFTDHLRPFEANFCKRLQLALHTLESKNVQCNFKIVEIAQVAKMNGTCPLELRFYASCLSAWICLLIVSRPPMPVSFLGKRWQRTNASIFSPLQVAQGWADKWEWKFKRGWVRTSNISFSIRVSSPFVCALIFVIQHVHGI